MKTEISDHMDFARYKVENPDRNGGIKTMLDRLTGYPSVDKPWLKFYTQEQINAELPKCKIYDYIWQNNKDYQSRTALNYYDRMISYGQMFAQIESTAKAFQNIGVKAGDVVSVITVTLPETIYTFYGLNRIGAIANMIDPRTSIEGIKGYIDEVQSKVVVVLDVAYEKVISAIQGTTAEYVIILSASDSLPVIKKQLYKITKGIRIQENSMRLRWKSFIAKYGKNQNTVAETEYKEDECCVIVHTGGTTGMPKGVMLSNDNLNCSAFQCFNSSLDFQRTHKWANIMPPFIAYGVGNGLHLPLVVGMEVILIPSFNPNKFDELLLKYHPSHMAGVPSHYENIMNSPKMKDKDISYLISPIVGGDSMRTELEEKVDKFINEHNGRNRLIKGYGMTEVSAAVSVCSSNECNKIGGVGVSFAHTIISVFDPETGKELSYNQKGEICMTGPNTMLGYFENTEETDKILRKHDDGRVWVHSGDLGYMDEDGQLFIEGRLKRMIVRHDGFKVFPKLIESVIQKSEYVNACCVVGMEDRDHTQGKLPIAFVVLNEKALSKENDVKSKLFGLCEKALPEYAQPQDICIIDQLPLTPIGKVDYRALEHTA